MVKIPFSTDFGSLNVSNAAAVALYQLQELSQNPKRVVVAQQ
jgi:tRNA G18 (ribose-2'-O)-methylase SpoU